MNNSAFAKQGLFFSIEYHLRKAIWLFSDICHPALDAGSIMLGADLETARQNRKYPVCFPQERKDKNNKAWARVPMNLRKKKRRTEMVLQVGTPQVACLLSRCPTWRARETARIQESARIKERQRNEKKLRGILLDTVRRCVQICNDLPELPPAEFLSTRAQSCANTAWAEIKEQCSPAEWLAIIDASSKLRAAEAARSLEEGRLQVAAFLTVQAWEGAAQVARSKRRD